MGNLNINRRISLILLLFAVGLFIIWIAFQQVSSWLAPVNSLDQALVEVNIPESSSTRRVAAILAENDLVRNPDIFVLYCRLKGCDGSLKAGIYQFRRSQGLEEIVHDIVEGRVVAIGLTIPEGVTLREIGEVLVKKEICTPQEWEQALLQSYDYPFLKHLPEGEKRLEGFLFPDTYQIRKDATPEQVVHLMLKRFNQVWNQDFAEEARQKGLTAYRVVTVASMIEEEALFDSERARIAGVMYNRLLVGMPLQVDATVLYSLGRHKNRVSLSDLKVDSPYNTYRYTGLPPGPISCPGAKSIAAALNPERHKYYYYVAKKNGYHSFSTTYQEHLQAKKAAKSQ